MFSNLSKKLVSIIDKIRNRGVLTEEIVDSTIREIRVSLLEADVALSVVKSFSSKLKEKLVGKSIINSVTPEQTIIKAVYDELVELLGTPGEFRDVKNGKVLMLGLQGTGKTTSSAKLANFIRSKLNRKVLLVSLDTYRPAAIDQLRILAQNNSIDFFDDFAIDDSPVDIAKKTLKVQNNYDVVIYDTAGRLYIDQSMMDEVSKIKELIHPDETFLVIDSMMGQDAVNMAKAFHDLIEITGLILTRIDGDSRGGAALSAKYITNCEIKYICTGEKIGDIERFHPERIASRILDQGDVISLVEKAMDANIADDMKNIETGKNFDLNSMEQYLKQLEKIGGISGFMKFIPGIGRIKDQLKDAGVNDKIIAKQIAIIRSMTKQERRDPKILNASRRRRIAKGCAQEVSDVNRLIKQFEQVKSMMTKFQNPGMMQALAGRLFK